MRKHRTFAAALTGAALLFLPLLLVVGATTGATDDLPWTSVSAQGDLPWT